jgi:hypothetical protein
MMKMFSDCSGPCEACKAHYLGGCLAGHGDDDYDEASPEWLIENEERIARIVKERHEFYANLNKKRNPR